VALEARLIRSADNVVVWAGEARFEQRVVDSKSMSAVVEALSEVAARAVAQLALDARHALTRVVGAGTPGVPPRL
jgi:hypothetical protein